MLDLKDDTEVVIDLNDGDTVWLQNRVAIRLGRKAGQRYRGMARLEITAERKIPIRLEKRRDAT